MSAELLDLDALEEKYAGPAGVWQVADVDVLSLIGQVRTLKDELDQAQSEASWCGSCACTECAQAKARWANSL